VALGLGLPQQPWVALFLRAQVLEWRLLLRLEWVPVGYRLLPCPLLRLTVGR
jgi:hypothetical protein